MILLPVPFCRISIHAPRVRCDFTRTTCPVGKSRISIHAPRVRCDDCYRNNFWRIFNFNPRTSCEVRQVFLSHHYRHPQISIHAPRVRCDFLFFSTLPSRLYFNPRTSCEVRPSTLYLSVTAMEFQSTHLV